MLSPYSCPSPPFLALSLKQARGSMVCSMVCSTSQTINHGLLYGLLYGLLRSLLRGLLYGLLYGLLCGVLHASPLLLTLTSALNPNSHQEQAHAHRSGRPSCSVVCSVVCSIVCPVVQARGSMVRAVVCSMVHHAGQGFSLKQARGSMVCSLLYGLPRDLHYGPAAVDRQPVQPVQPGIKSATLTPSHFTGIFPFQLPFPIRFYI